MTNQIKTIQLSTGTWVLMKVPADGCEFAINKIDGRQYLTADKGEPEGSEFYVGTDPLPAGHTYTLIGLSKDLSIDKIYDTLNMPKTALEDLLKSQGMDIDTTVILRQND